MTDLKEQVSRATIGQGDMVDLRGKVETMNEAYALQDAGEPAMIATFGPVIGRKIAMNSAAQMAQMGLSEPVTARMYQSGLIETGRSLRLSENPNLAVEAELCVTLARNVSADETLDLDGMADVIASIVPAFEILNRRNMPTLNHVPSLVAHNICWAYTVLGVSTGTGDPMRAKVVLNRDDQELLNGVGTAPQPPAQAALNVVRNLQSRGISLGKGERIICGTHIAPVDVKVPCDFHFSVEGVGEVSLSISA